MTCMCGRITIISDFEIRTSILDVGDEGTMKSSKVSGIMVQGLMRPSFASESGWPVGPLVGPSNGCNSAISKRISSKMKSACTSIIGQNLT